MYVGCSLLGFGASTISLLHVAPAQQYPNFLKIQLHMHRHASVWGVYSLVTKYMCICYWTGLMHHFFNNPSTELIGMMSMKWFLIYGQNLQGTWSPPPSHSSLPMGLRSLYWGSLKKSLSPVPRLTNNVRVHSYAQSQLINVLKHFEYILYGSEMQPTRVWSLNHDITMHIAPAQQYQ